MTNRSSDEISWLLMVLCIYVSLFISLLIYEKHVFKLFSARVFCIVFHQHFLLRAVIACYNNHEIKMGVYQHAQAKHTTLCLNRVIREILTRDFISLFWIMLTSTFCAHVMQPYFCVFMKS